MSLETDESIELKMMEQKQKKTVTEGTWWERTSAGESIGLFCFS